MTNNYIQNNNLFNEYINTLIQKGSNQRTLRNYEVSIKKFLDYFGDRALKHIKEQEITNEFFQYLLSLNLSKYTSYQTIYHIKLFLDYLNLNGYNVVNLNHFYQRQMLPFFKDNIKNTSLVILKKSQVKKIKNYWDKLGYYSLGISKLMAERNQIIIELMIDYGFSIANIEKLKIKNIDFEKSSIQLSDVRNIKIQKDLMKKIKNYISLRLDKSDWLFIADDHCSNSQENKKNFSARSIQRMVKKAISELGLNKEITPKSLRHTYHYNLMLAGEKNEKINKNLGFNAGYTIAKRKIISSVLNNNYYTMNELAKVIKSDRGVIKDLCSNGNIKYKKIGENYYIYKNQEICINGKKMVI